MPAFLALVVDDEVDIQLLFRQRFRKEIKTETITFHFVTSGQEALVYLADNTEANVVLVLSDINMPGMTGLELLRRIKEQYPHLPVHMITAYGDDFTYNKALEYGADGYLNKPIDFNDLKANVFRL